MDDEEIKLMAYDYNYNGPSMNPTLRAGDGLRVLPYKDRPIKVGDVVVFRSRESDYYVVHRVIFVSPQAIRTRGDNNSYVDSWILQPEDIIGRVVSVQRRDKSITIYGGTSGRILAPVLWTKRRIKLRIFRVLSPVYHGLARSGILRKMLPRGIKTEVIYFKRPNGVEMQLLLGRMVIARRPPGRDQWQIRRPFRLFLDEASLPK